MDRKSSLESGGNGQSDARIRDKSRECSLPTIPDQPCQFKYRTPGKSTAMPNTQQRVES
jgi:hypothetical protein